MIWSDINALSEESIGVISKWTAIPQCTQEDIFETQYIYWSMILTGHMLFLSNLIKIQFKNASEPSGNSLAAREEGKYGLYLMVGR